MSTQEQTNANRQNAQSSTGPKTDEGKAISSQNAVKHGFFAKNDVISGEDPALYEQHRADIYDEYFPMTTTESVLTQRIASLSWRLMRADRLQTTTINTLVDAQQKTTHQPGLPQFNITAMIKTLREKDADPESPLTDAGIILAGLARYKYEPVTTDPAVDAAIDNAMQPAVGNRICEAEIQLGTVIYNDFHGSAVIERIQGYEQKIETSLFKTIRQFQQLQETRRKAQAAQDKRDWAYLRQEDEAKRNRKEAKHREMSMRTGDPPAPDQRIQNEPNPRTAGVSPAPHSRQSPDSATTNYELPTTNSIIQNEPNPDLTSISEITYNRSRREKAKRNQSEDPTRRGQPDRSTNK